MLLFQWGVLTVNRTVLKHAKAIGACRRNISLICRLKSQTGSAAVSLRRGVSWRLLPPARQLGTSQDDDKDTRFEKENIFTVPNILSLGRITLSPFLGYMVLSEHYKLALTFFVLAGVSDMVDGYIARNFKGQSSHLGSVLDPLADKFLVSILYVTLTVNGIIPVPLTALILGRDGLLIAASFYLRYITLPPPKTWSRYWDIQRSTIQVTPSMQGKVNTILQLLLVGVSLIAPITGLLHHPLLTALWLITGATTLSSGVGYFYRFKGFKVLKNNSTKPP